MEKPVQRLRSSSRMQRELSVAVTGGRGDKSRVSRGFRPGGGRKVRRCYRLREDATRGGPGRGDSAERDARTSDAKAGAPRGGCWLWALIVGAHGGLGGGSVHGCGFQVRSWRSEQRSVRTEGRWVTTHRGLGELSSRGGPPGASGQGLVRTGREGGACASPSLWKDFPRGRVCSCAAVIEGAARGLGGQR